MIVIAANIDFASEADRTGRWRGVRSRGEGGLEGRLGTSMFQCPVP